MKFYVAAVVSLGNDFSPPLPPVFEVGATWYVFGVFIVLIYQMLVWKIRKKGIVLGRDGEFLIVLGDFWICALVAVYEFFLIPTFREYYAKIPHDMFQLSGPTTFFVRVMPTGILLSIAFLLFVACGIFAGQLPQKREWLQKSRTAFLVFALLFTTIIAISIMWPCFGIVRKTP